MELMMVFSKNKTSKNQKTLGTVEGKIATITEHSGDFPFNKTSLFLISITSHLYVYVRAWWLQLCKSFVRHYYQLTENSSICRIFLLSNYNLLHQEKVPINPQLYNVFLAKKRKEELLQTFYSVTKQPHRGKYRAFSIEMRYVCNKVILADHPEVANAYCIYIQHIQMRLKDYKLLGIL